MKLRGKILSMAAPVALSASFCPLLIAASPGSDTSSTTTTRSQPTDNKERGYDTGAISGSRTENTDKQATTPKTTTTTQTPPASDAMVANANVAVVTFARGSADLKDEQKAALKQAVALAQDKDQVRIAVWSDKSWVPEDKGDKFTKQDKKIAEDRGKAIKQYLSSTFPKKDVEVFPMTENVGFFAKLFNTEESEIKSVFAKKGDKASQDRPVSQDTVMIRDHGGPSKAVVFIKKG